MRPHPGWSATTFTLVFAALTASTAVLAAIALAPADRVQVAAKLVAMRDDVQAVLDRGLVPTDQALFRLDGRSAEAPRRALGAREPSLRVQCQNNLKQIGLALHNYFEANNHPPTNILDRDGRPMLSWRVNLLPYLDLNADYSKFKFDRPWTDPYNLAAAKEMRFNPFCCPVTPSGSLTNYVAITGPGTALDPADRTKDLGLRAEPKMTLMAVECVYTGIHWMEPRDFTLEELRDRINEGLTRSISSRHPGGANVVFSDGHVRILGDELSPEVLKALVTDRPREDEDGSP